jgi:similar to stage IV sporulation protein
MFIKIWNFLLGYVKIDMSGFSAERLINQAAAAGIILWDMRRVQIAISVNVSLKDYARLQRIAARTGTKLKAVRFVGLPIILGRLRKRVALLLGCVLFVAGLVVLTSFIWRIDVTGTDRLEADEILEFLAESGFGIGTFRYGIAYRDVESLLMAQFADIAWVSLVINGTAAHIRLAETIVRPEIVDLYTPTDIVAAKDGLIIQMATSLGTPMFVPGDVVRAGEVLVSGRLTIGVEGESISYEYVRARSEIWARLYYDIKFDIPLVFYEKSFTGRVQRVYSIMVWGREFILPHRRHNFIYHEAVTSHRQLSLGENYPLPLGHTVTENFELVRHLHRRTAEEAVAIGEELVAGRIAEELPEHAQILMQEISFAEGEYAVTMEVFLVTIERIDMEKAISFNINPE